MAGKTEIKARLEFWREALTKLRRAYLALIDGGVQKYTIYDRTLTRFDLPDLQEKIAEAERKVDELEALANGQGARKAFGVVPRDW